jgi:E3 ubiquitin-protein ligase RNF14
MAHSEKVVMEYLASEEDSEERSVIEQRYGKNNIVRLVHRYQEEVANKEWLDKSTTGCPGCSCHVEKTMGCNHASALLFLVVADPC